MNDWRLALPGDVGFVRNWISEPLDRDPDDTDRGGAVIARREVFDARMGPQHRCQPPLEHEAHETHPAWSGLGAARPTFPRFLCDCGALYVRSSLGWERLEEAGGEAL